MKAFFDDAPKIDSFKGQYDFLSNFHESPVHYDNVCYPTVEHAFVAAKSTDKDFRKQVLDCRTPGEAKKIGRKVKLRSDWELIKVKVMNTLLIEKFQDPDLREKLLATDGFELIEGNWWGDVFWGVCNGDGKNVLGKLLMKIRQEIIDGN